jgi:hypothetical protein
MYNMYNEIRWSAPPPAGPARALPQLAVWDFWRGFARARAEFSLHGGSLSKVAAALAKAAATLDSDPLRKIPREKFRTKINATRARANVPQF